MVDSFSRDRRSERSDSKTCLCDRTAEKRCGTLKVAFLLIFLTLAACAGGGQQGELLTDVPTKRAIFAAEAEPLAACALSAIDSAIGPGSTKSDLPTEQKIILSMTSSGVRYYQAIFHRESAGRTSVQITTAQTLMGPFPITDKVFAAISTCAKPVA